MASIIEKTIRLANRDVKLHGIGDGDPYLAHLSDGAEAPFTLFCQKYLRQDSVAIDVGANIGVTALILDSLLPSGKIIAIEAGPRLAKVLQVNLAENNAKNVSVIQAAVSDRDGSVNFFEASAYGFMCDDDVKDHPTTRVPMTTVDNIVETHGLDRVDFIKIDVEGFEDRVLAGATKTIECFQPIIILEFNLWCLTAFSKVNALELAQALKKKFKFMGVLRSPPRYPELLTRIADHEVTRFVHDAIVNAGANYDLVVTSRDVAL